MKDIPIQKLFRIQGGVFPNRSREYIKVKDNKILCPMTKSIHIGNTEHMIHFLFKRLGITQIEDMPENVEEYDIHIVEMYVPYWMTYLIEKYSVDELKNRNKTYPKLVDKTTPGQSYQLINGWSKLLEASCIFAQDNKIKKEKDIQDILFSKNFSKINKNDISLDVERISELIYKCKISTADICALKDLWNLDIIMEKGEENDK